jgi:flagellar hook assembly protein FlgD
MPSDVTMEVYDVAGKRVSMSRLEGLAAGEHALALHGRATNGTPLSSGVYFCRVSAHGETATRKIVVQR